MNFLYPDFLYALSAVAIPILIHLFNFRNFKTVYFSNVQFLREVKQETRSRSRLKHLLVLLSRILAIICLVLAFAQPYVPGSSKTIAGKNGINVYLDNSFSMDAESADGRVFELGKQYAYEIGGAYGSTDAFQLLTNDFEGRHHRSVSRNDFSELVDEVSISPSVRYLSEVVNRQVSSLGSVETAAQTLFIISDFQQSISDFANLVPDSSYQVNLIPITPNPTSNLYIDSVWFQNPVHQLNAPQELSVRIKNLSNEDFDNVPVKLLINGQQKSLASVNVNALETVDTVLVYTPKAPGVQQAEVVITDYPITFDDHFYFSYKIREQLSVISISSNGDTTGFIPALFQGDNYFQVEYAAENKLDYSSLRNYQVLIIDGLNIISTGLAAEIRKYTENGGVLLVFPGTQVDLASYQAFLSSMNCDSYLGLDTVPTAVGKLNVSHPIFRNVFESIPTNMDLPAVRKHYTLSEKVNTNRENLFSLSSGQVFMGSYAFGKGQVYLSSVPLDAEFSNFPRHAVFVPTVYNAALFSQVSDRLSYTIGRDDRIALDRLSLGADQALHLRSKALQTDIIPEHRSLNFKTNIYVHNQVERAGNYMLTKGEEELFGLAFNYERNESDLRTLTESEVQEALDRHGLHNFSLLDSDYQTLAKNLEELSRGKHYWRWCILFALIFLAFEVALIKLWKS